MPWLLSVIRPDWLWTADRSLLISLQAFSYGLALLFIILNIRPRSGERVGRPEFRWFHRLPLALLGVGVMAEAAVVLLNHGQMPLPDSYLAMIQDPATVTAIRSQALYLKQLIGPDTRLPWLGQTWRCDWLARLHLTPIPLVSPAEVIIAAGLFLTGISQFLGWPRPEPTQSAPIPGQPTTAQ